MSSKDEINKYKQAVWDYMLEHCDITENGSYFVKFHTQSRQLFEKRVYARLKGYHRHDTRMDFSRKQKEKDATARRVAHLSRKEAKRRKRRGTILPLNEQRVALAKIKSGESEILAEFGKALCTIHSQTIQLVAQWCYTKISLCLKKRQSKKKKMQGSNVHTVISNRKAKED